MINDTHARIDRQVNLSPAAPARRRNGIPGGSGSLRHICPLCQGPLTRIFRRRMDRFFSLFVPVHRFRCDAFCCGWEGNRRVDGADSAKPPTVLERANTAFKVALVLVTSVALAVVLAAAVIGWYTALERERDLLGSRESGCAPAIYSAGAPSFAPCTGPAITG